MRASRRPLARYSWVKHVATEHDDSPRPCACGVCQFRPRENTAHRPSSWKIRHHHTQAAHALPALCVFELDCARVLYRSNFVGADLAGKLSTVSREFASIAPGCERPCGNGTE